MGGYGSGTWNRTNKRSTTESCKTLDVRQLKRQGWLRPGCSGIISWMANAEPLGSINFQCSNDSLALTCQYLATGDDWEHSCQTLAITTTPCNYGNDREWFICPRCDQRCAIVYGPSYLFYCRRCSQLSYNSQNLGVQDNLYKRKHQLGRLIFEVYRNGIGWQKKKGMHWKTFNRLHADYQRIEARICQGIRLRFE